MPEQLAATGQHVVVEVVCGFDVPATAHAATRNDAQPVIVFVPVAHGLSPKYDGVVEECAVAFWDLVEPLEQVCELLHEPDLDCESVGANLTRVVFVVAEVV